MITTFEAYWSLKGEILLEMGYEKAIVSEIWHEGNDARKFKLLEEICYS